MHIERRTTDGVVVLAIAGDITMNGREGLRIADLVRTLAQEGRRHILLDLRRVRYVDSAGLGELVQAWSAARNRGGRIGLLHVGGRLSELLVMTKLLTVFDCYESEPEAVANLIDSPAR
ncbi:MAG: STAS domain-containing protein [Vicinamibacterales bacterium]